MHNVGRDGFGGMSSKSLPSTSPPAVLSSSTSHSSSTSPRSPQTSRRKAQPLSYAIRAPPHRQRTQDVSFYRRPIPPGGDVPYEDLDMSTIYMVDWGKWNEVLKGFESLKWVSFVPLDSGAYGGRCLSFFSYIPGGLVGTKRRRSSFSRLTSLHKRDVEFRFA